MSEELKEMIDWKPMKEDFESVNFNSYGSGQIGAHLPIHLLPQSVDKHNKGTQNIRLYLDGFPPDLKETGLKNFLQRIGCQSIVELKIFRDRKESLKIGRPFSIVDFSSAKAAKSAVELIKSQRFFKIFVCFMTTESDNNEKCHQIDEEFKKFKDKLKQQNQQMRENGELDPFSTNQLDFTFRFK